MEQIPKALSDMEIGDLCHHGRYEIFRVPGGWVYTCCQDSGAGGFNVSSCFVPMPAEEVEFFKSKYMELLYQVQQIIPGETRHETACRIIRQHESSKDSPVQWQNSEEHW